MKKNEIMKSANKTFNKIGFQIKKKSPEILIVAGVIGVVTSAVMACRATIKATKIADEAKKDIDAIHEAEAVGETKGGESYSAEDSKKDLTIVYTHTAGKYAKLYAPSVVLGVASIVCIVASHNVMKERSIAIATAYAKLDKTFKDYRGRVVERFGEQVEKELRYNIKAKEIEEIVTDEKGKTKTVKEVADVAAEGWDPSQYSPYAKIFDESHPQWTKDAEMNRYYLLARQAQATDMLRAKGHLFLNEVYDMLRFPRTKAGAVVGWIYDPNRPEYGDSYVDFGMYEVRREKAVDFVNGYERSFILDFNVVGDITNDIADHQFM